MTRPTKKRRTPCSEKQHSILLIHFQYSVSEEGPTPHRRSAIGSQAVSEVSPSRQREIPLLFRAMGFPIAFPSYLPILMGRQRILSKIPEHAPSSGNSKVNNQSSTNPAAPTEPLPTRLTTYYVINPFSGPLLVGARVTR